MVRIRSTCPIGFKLCFSCSQTYTHLLGQFIPESTLIEPKPAVAAHKSSALELLFNSIQILFKPRIPNSIQYSVAFCSHVPCVCCLKSLTPPHLQVASYGASHVNRIRRTGIPHARTAQQLDARARPSVSPSPFAIHRLFAPGARIHYAALWAHRARGMPLDSLPLHLRYLGTGRRCARDFATRPNEGRAIPMSNLSMTKS
ncbi:hypothetical protein C8R45DRAFT_319568 [Mycena sanguinolenta]|nr:hypothetical protein C8R45DRAFT_319568 [Mycena sanguinolenta]